MGRPRKPTALKILAGNPGHHPLPENEPIYDRGARPPGPPPYLRDKRARKEWKRIAAQLNAVGLLAKVDLNALAAYCSAFVRWLDAEEHIKETGAVILTSNGYPVQSPWLQISNKALEQMHKFGVEFGMTPASRSRVKTTDAPEEKSLAALLFDGVTADSTHG